MLTDPLSVTYDASAYSLPRANVPWLRGAVVSSFRDAASGLSVITERPVSASPFNKRVIFMVRKDYDDTNPGDGTSSRRWGNGVGLVYDVDTSRFEYDDIPLLRTCVQDLVNGSLADRIIAGEG